MHKTISDILRILEGEWLGSQEDLAQWVESVTIDSRQVTERALFVPIIGERHDGHQFVKDSIVKGASMSLWKKGHLSPPKDMPVLVVEDPIQAMQRLAQDYRVEVGCKVVAVTGSVGKTTTKDMITSLMRTRYRTHANMGNYNNEIGLPLTILSMPDDTEVAVLEMGMNHFGEIELLSQISKPDFAVITNIGESHIEFLGSRAGIAEAKLEILVGMNEEGFLLYPENEPLIPQSKRFQRFNGKKLSCGSTAISDLCAEVKEDLGLGGFILKSYTSEAEYTVPIPGLHNAQNAIYALGIGTLLHLSASDINKGFSQISLSKMRMEQLKGKNGATIINDAYNASPTSIRAALQFFAKLSGYPHKIVILGDVGELGEHGPQMHAELGRLLNPDEFPQVYLMGPLMKYAAGTAHELGYQQVKHIEQKEELIALLEPFLGQETILLFKASRFMQLEQIILALT